jgi:hypothetical protein
VINPRLDKTNAVTHALVVTCARVCDRPVYGHRDTRGGVVVHRPRVVVPIGLVVPARVALDTNSIRGGGGGRWVGRQILLVEQVHGYDRRILASRPSRPVR